MHCLSNQPETYYENKKLSCLCKTKTNNFLQTLNSLKNFKMATCKHETENTFLNPYRLYTNRTNSIIFVFHTMEVLGVRTENPCLRRPVPVRTALIHKMEHRSIICSTFDLKRAFPKWFG